MGMKRAVSGLMMLLVLTGVLISAFTVRPVRADDVIYIRADGEIDPPTANITTSDNSTYLFTGDNAPRIQIERDNIVLDGNHYLLNPSDPRCFALSIWANHNVTVRNLEIYADNVGIYVGNSTDVLIETNSARAYYGMYVDNCCSLTIRENTIDASIAIEGMNLSGQNLISKNTVVNTLYGAMELISVSNVLITENSLTGPDWAGPEGIVLQGSNITISRNDIDTHGYGMKVLMPSATSDISIMENTISDADGAILIIGPVPLTPFNFTNIRIYHNNFLDNRGQVHIYDGGSCFLDNGYPSGGNYWSDYSGTDVFSGSYQNETGSDGIEDNPYVIEPDMVDHYPLMTLWQLGPVHNINSGLYYDSIQEAINAPTTSDGHTILVSAGAYHEDLVVNKSLSLIGEDWESTVIEGSPQIIYLFPYAVVEVVTSGVNVSGFTIRNSGVEGSSFTGIYISSRFGHVSNCTISFNKIVGNNVADLGPYYGGANIKSEGSFNVITQNVVLNSSTGICLLGNDTIFRNLFIGGDYFGSAFGNGDVGCMEGSGINLIYENTFIGNTWVFLGAAGYDTVYHNNFIDYQYPLGWVDIWAPQNIWDNGYPSGGNYWSGHNSADVYSGPYQNETGSDGICDNPLIVAPINNNTDAYPLVRPWGLKDFDDVDLDGIPNYLDLSGLNITFCNADPDIFGGNWNTSVYLATPGKSVAQMASTLRTWGVDSLGTYSDLAALVVETESPYPNSHMLIEWLRQFFTISSEDESDTDLAMANANCSDGKSRFLVVLTHNEGTDWTPNYYSLVDHSPIAVVPLIVAAAPIWLPILKMAVEIAKHNYVDWKDEVAKQLVVGILTTWVFKTESIVWWVVDVFWDSVELAAAVDDPFIDLAAYDSTGAFVLGYNGTTTIANSSCGVYTGRIDSIQMMLLSKDALPLQAVVTNKGTQRETYTGIVSQIASNETTIFGGTLEQNENTTAAIYVSDSLVKVNHLSIECNMPSTSVLKGEVIPLDMVIRDENMSLIDTATVEALCMNQSFSVLNLGGGNYSTLVDTSLLEYGNLTIRIAADNPSYLGAIAQISVSVTFNLMPKSINKPWSVVGKGFSRSFNATVENQGSYVGSSNLTAYANETAVRTCVVVFNGQDLDVVFVWNTTDFDYGNYAISLGLAQVTGERNISDNTLVDDWVYVGIPGDINADTRVDIFDAILLAGHFNQTPLNPLWNANVDINGDSIIDIYDAIILAGHFNEHT
jgi:nitrous oxidase accessory protein NosD